MKKSKTLTMITLLTLLTLFININEVKADDVTSQASYYLNNEIMSKEITDYDEKTFIDIKKNDEIKIESRKTVIGVYVVYELKSQTGNIQNGNDNIEIGKNGFLHEYIELKPTNEFTITYNEDVQIAEIYVIDKNGCPDYIEKWEKPLDENADLLLFSTHFDDDTLYLGGVIPTYIAKGRNVQVVYYTYANPNENYRYHETLHALYKMGSRNYPVFGIVPDEWSDTLKWAMENLEDDGLTVDDAIDFQVEMIRRFKPEVIVAHDENGEYGHGQHRMNTYTLKMALEKTNDPNYHFDSYAVYGIWNTPKTYIHLYEKNKIKLDFDIPLKYFGGKTAYQMSVIGFEQHKSQQHVSLIQWLLGENGEIEKASQISSLSPTEYGLYRSLVGEDVNKNDMFENLMYEEHNNESIYSNNQYYDDEEYNDNKLVIPNLYNIITVVLVIFAVLLYFEMSPMKIYSLLIKLKELVISEFKGLKNDTENQIKKDTKKVTGKKNSSTKKQQEKKSTSKKTSSTKKTQEKESTSKTTTKKKTNSSKTKK